MRETKIIPGAAEPIGPYSHTVVANGFVYVSGQGPLDPETGGMSADIKQQVRQTLENIRTILLGVDIDMGDVVKVNVFLSDLSNFEAFDAVYREFFPEDFPARTTVGAQLHDILVEIDCIAVLR